MGGGRKSGWYLNVTLQKTIEEGELRKEVFPTGLGKPIGGGENSGNQWKKIFRCSARDRVISRGEREKRRMRRLAIILDSS